MTRRGTRLLLALIALGLLASSCAYYNTFYLARKYYFRATVGQPYPVDKVDPAQGQNYSKSIEFSKKVLANYPKSSWVDDAYLLWARALLGRDDPRETVNMLQDFAVRFPESKVRSEALFYLGVGYGRSHRYSEAELALAQYLEQRSKGEMAPYAWLERSRALASLDRDSAAAYCASQVLERFPKSRLGPQALAARATALFEAGQYTRAQTDFHALGLMARDDEERLTFLLREADCLEAGRQFATVNTMLRSALSHERLPTVNLTANGTPAPYAPTPGGDRYGRILMRIGTAQLAAGDQKAALDAYQEVARLYPKSPLSAEAEYRIGYAFETVGDDFKRAREEYGKVREEFANSAFAAQAQSRIGNLDRVTQFRTAAGDTLQRRAETGLMLAELYLFQLDKPERALEEYRKVAEDSVLKGTGWVAKALTAQAWVLDRKLGRRATADSLLWAVVREHPATEAQLAARDYLEADGQSVPDTLIRAPLAPLVAPPPQDTTRLTSPPASTPGLGQLAAADSAAGGRLGPPAPGMGRPPQRRGAFLGMVSQRRPAWDPRYAGLLAGAPGLVGDSPFTAGRASPDDSAYTRLPQPPRAPGRPSPRDSLPGHRPKPPVPAPRDTLPGHPPLPPVPSPPDSVKRPAPPDSTRQPAPPDTTRRPAPADTTRRPVAPDTTRSTSPR